MRNEWLGWIVVVFALFITQGCRAPSPDWNGSWRLNPAKSSYQGTVFTISISGDGDYRYDNGNSSFTLRCDGKDRPMGNGRTQACVKSSDTVLDLTRKENGAKTSVYHWQLSADGTVLTATMTSLGPRGPVDTSQLVASRISGSNDFAGQWRDTGYLQRRSEMMLQLDSQALHISYPNAKQYIDLLFNGADAAVRGPHAPDGTTYAVRRAGRREILTLTKRNGKILTQGSLDLSSDGRTVTDTWWNPDRPDDKGTLVYEKQ